jgi:TRAP-type C4-dicarboxylate transport system substrate-binding protein
MIMSVCFILGLAFFPMTSLAGSKSGQELKLIFATYIPVGYPQVYPGLKLFVDLVNQKGKGVVKLDAYFGGTLLDGGGLLPGLQAGTADIIGVPGAYLLGSFPVLGIHMLPIWHSGSESMEKLKIGTPLAQLQNEVLKKKNLFQLATSGVLPEILFTRDKAVKNPSDMKGLKIRVAGKVEAKVIQTLGAVPVTMPSAEVGQALQRGVVDGVLLTPFTAKGNMVDEFCKYVLVYPLTNMDTPVYVLHDKWEKWPENVRQVLMDAAIAWEPRYIGGKGAIANDDVFDDLIGGFIEKGVTPIYPSEENADAFAKATRPVVDWWVKQVGEDVGREALKYTNYKK